MGPFWGGIYPLVSYRNACFLNNEVGGIRVCEELLERYRDKSREEAAALAEEIAVETARAMAPYVGGYYIMVPFRRVELITRIMARLRALPDTDGGAV